MMLARLRLLFQGVLPVFFLLISSMELHAEWIKPQTCDEPCDYEELLARDDVAETEEDTPVTIDVLANDDFYTYINIAASTSIGDIVINSDGTITYTPPDNFYGVAYIDYTISNYEGDSSDAVVTVNVLTGNDSPIAYDDSYEIDSYDPVFLNVVQNDTDPDDDLILVVSASTDEGSVSIVNNQLYYIPPNGFVGLVAIDYIIEDTAGAQDQAQAFVMISVETETCPCITAPDTITVKAKGLLTPVDTGLATAIDDEGNIVPVALIDDKKWFEPGRHTLIWMAADGTNGAKVATQQINVVPKVSLSQDQKVNVGDPINVHVYLNGVSPTYPVEIPFALYGSATKKSIGDSLIDGVITIESGMEGVITFDSDTLLTDTTSEMFVELDKNLNLGHQSVHKITVVDHVLIPNFEVKAYQDSQQRWTVDKNGGPVYIEALIDAVDLTQWVIEWRNAHSDMRFSTMGENRIVIEPEQLNTGTYRLTAAVYLESDPSMTHTYDFYLRVVEQLAPLEGSDSDGDGLTDQEETHNDSNLNGIADYLDAALSCNVLATRLSPITHMSIESDPSICLRLGYWAMQMDNGGVLWEEEFNFTDDTFQWESGWENTSGVIDIMAHSPMIAGESHYIVIPQEVPLVPGSEFRIYRGNVWASLVVDEANAVFSASTQQGVCPAPGDESWTPGLTIGHWCVQVMIEDGGQNDADEEKNQQILLTGGVAIPSPTIIENQAPIAADDRGEIFSDESILFDVLNQSQDPDNDELTIVSVEAFNGIAVLKNNKIHYQPNANFEGVDTINYTIDDGKGATDSGRIEVTVKVRKQPVSVEMIGGGSFMLLEMMMIALLVAWKGVCSLVSVNTGHAKQVIKGKKHYWLVSLLFLGQAQATSNNIEKAVYFSSHLGSVSSHVDVRAIQQSFQVGLNDDAQLEIEDTRYGYDLALGYQFTNALGVAVGYADLGDVSVKYNGNNSNPEQIYRELSDITPYSARGVTLSATLDKNLSDFTFVQSRYWSVFASAGLFHWKAKYDSFSNVQSDMELSEQREGDDWFVGAGVRLKVDDIWSVKAGWDRFKLDEQEADRVFVGIHVLFDAPAKVSKQVASLMKKQRSKRLSKTKKDWELVPLPLCCPADVQKKEVHRKD